MVPICLPFGKILTANIIGQYGEVAGWGLIDSDDVTGTPYLQTVKVKFLNLYKNKKKKTIYIFHLVIKLPIVELPVCSATYSPTVNVSYEQMCAGGSVGKDSCNGDSGGPLVKVLFDFFYNVISITDVFFLGNEQFFRAQILSVWNCIIWSKAMW